MPLRAAASRQRARELPARVQRHARAHAASHARTRALAPQPYLRLGTICADAARAPFVPQPARSVTMVLTLPKYVLSSAALTVAVIWHAMHTRRAPRKNAAHDATHRA
jgi:hypothetical protein